MDRSIIFARWRPYLQPSIAWFLGSIRVCSQMASRSVQSGLTDVNNEKTDVS